MPGMFDDLVPQAPASSSGGGGMFDDLVPSAPVDDHGLADRQKMSAGQLALNPITSYPETYSQMNRESRAQMSRGVDQLSNPSSAWDVAKGAANVGLGGAGYLASPINAAYRTLIGQPVEDTTGIPREYTEFAAQLATPGLGMRSLSERVPGAPLGPSDLQPRVASKMPVPEADAAKDIGIDLSRGQATQDLDSIRYEDMAARGAYGPKAQEEAAKFFQNQFQQIQSAGTNVGQRLSRTGMTNDSAADAAGIANTELGSVAQQARAARDAAQQEAEQEAASSRAMVGDQQTALDDALREGHLPIENPREAGEIVGQGVRQAAAGARDQYRNLYTTAFNLPGELHADAVHGIGARIQQTLSHNDNPVIIDDIGHPDRLA